MSFHPSPLPNRKKRLEESRLDCFAREDGRALLHVSGGGEPSFWRPLPMVLSPLSEAV